MKHKKTSLLKDGVLEITYTPIKSEQEILDELEINRIINRVNKWIKNWNQQTN